MLSMWGHTAEATSYMSRVSDTLSTSAPGSPANHTILFTVPQAIPPSGAIEIRFNEGGFSIPSSGFNFGDVDVGFSAVQGGPYTQRPLAASATAGTDGVTVTTGTTSAKLRIKLNSSVGISGGSEVEIRLGTNASYGAIGDTQISLSNATGTYPVTIYSFNAADTEVDYGRTRIVVITPVTIGPVDTTDTTPPVILYAAPTGLLQAGTQGVQLTIQTDEFASCRFATSSSLAFAAMPYSMAGTTTGYALWNFANVTGLENDVTYTYYIRCRDFRLNTIDPPYMLEFTIGIPPGSATSTATSTGTGYGTGNASTSVQGGPGTGTGTGSGGGPSGSGSGNGPNGGDTAGSGSGGSGGSGGTKLLQASIKIDGWAYPGATVSILRDGVITSGKPAGGDAAFSSLTEGLDRGSYSFSMYAVDSKGVRSATFATTLWLRSDTLNTLSNVMLPPTLSVANNSVQPGTPLALSGYSAPNAIIMVWLRPRLAEVSTQDIIATTTASTNGTWSLSLPTTGATVGTYELVAQGFMQNSVVQSDKSARMTIGIGVGVSEGDCGSKGDLNCDGFINLVDFSILLFNWNTTNTSADINKDGTVSLPDFSIMLYNWTG